MSGEAAGALSPADIDAFRCLAAVEATLAEQRQKTDIIQAALEILLQRMLNLGDTSAPEINELGTPEEESETGRPYHSGWREFEIDFKEHFLSHNRQAIAITQLEGISWYQGLNSIDD
ncbi:hypothetical protein M422DRAFT_254591 [Sphaerobolus stellatus SS14]|uniref:Uncharacterized protein n=1 Tax=Sphaerobolus stellatus (strain SS14) TaxID=990650 RepID=A0A0C9VV87_SPHS4|nr:hypothetical protein M422DRAFT_254591 [Sphaerobolus stellatus SS14]